MITRLDLSKHDSSNMHEIYDRWPKIARETYDNEFDQISFKEINHIVFAGMGGSGAIGDLFSSILSKNNIHVSVIKGYLLPKTVDKNTLIVTTSVSGNSKETLTVLEDAKKLESFLIAFSSGGKMEKFCLENKINHCRIEMVHSPRSSFIKYIYSMLKIFDPILSITKNDVNESIKQLQNLSKKITSENLTETNPALSLAQWIQGIPLIYYPHGLQAAAIRFKSSLQENAKTHAMAEDVIEACHNGIVGWERSSQVQPILIRGKDDYFKTKDRWEILKQYFNKNQIDFREINSTEGHILTKLVSLIYLLDYTSIYKAVLYHIDPSPVKSIDFIKEML